MPRALFVATVATTLEAFLLPYAAMLRARGWKVDAVARGASRCQRLATAFDNTHEIEWSRRPWQIWNLTSASRRISEIVVAGGYDVVHVHTPVASFVARYALRAGGARPAVIYTAHGFHFHAGGNAVTNPVFHGLEAMAAGWTDWMVTMNREDFRAAQRFARIRKDRVRYIPGIGVDCERYRPHDENERAGIRESEGIGAEQFALAVVGEFTPNKRQALAVEALRYAGPTVVGVFIGDGPRRLAVERHAKANGAPARFLGHRRDAGRLIAACDALMHVSRREGLPRVVLEAAASEVPVIGTRTRGTADILEVTGGIVVDPADPPSLGYAVRSLVDDRARCRSLGAQGRTAVRTTYGLHHTLDQYGRLYDEIMSQGASPDVPGHESDNGLTG